MRFGILLLVIALSVQATGCAGYQAAMQEIAANANDPCRQITSHHPRQIAGIRLPQSNRLVCTDSPEGNGYRSAIAEVTEGCGADCYRDETAKEYTSSVCSKLDTVLESMSQQRYWREPILATTGGASVGLTHRISYYPIDTQGIIPVSRRTMLDFERKSACGQYRVEIADAQAQAQEIAARETRQKAIQQEAARKVAALEKAKRDAERAKKIARVCPGGLFDLGDLLFANPYDVKGKCYGFAGKTLQIMSRSTGFYQLGRDKRVLIDFGKDAAPSHVYSGYVKGIGTYSYETVLGAQMTVPSLVVPAIPVD